MSFNIAPPPPPKTADNQLVETDYNALSPVNDLSAYRDLFFSAPAIGAALDYANLPADVRSAIWAQCDYAETNSQSEAVARPADYPVAPFVIDVEDFLIEFTRPETLAMFASHTAHNLYHEVHQTFPWRMTDYPQDWAEHVMGVAAFKWGFSSVINWDAPGGPTTYGYRVNAIVNHDPNIAYAIAQPLVASATTPQEAVSNILLYCRNLSHGIVSWDPRKAVDLVDQWDAQNIQPFGGRYASRRGCHSSCGIFLALARAVNIPAQYVSAWPPAINHHSVEFRSADLVMQHCDDNYGYHIMGEALPAKRTCFSYSYYVDNIYPLDKYAQATSDICWRLRKDREMETVAEFYQSAFVNPLQGWAYVRPLFDPYYVGEESLIDDFYYRLVSVTGSDGGGGPTLPPPPAPDTGTIVVDAGLGYPFVDWVITPDPGGGNGSGTGHATFEAPINDYTLTWQDSYPYYNPPGPEGPKTLVDNGTITFGPPVYAPE